MNPPVTPQQTLSILNVGEGVLVDVRAPSDWSKGVAPGAVCLSADQLIQQAAHLVNNHGKVCVMCYRGNTATQLVNRLNQQFIGQFYVVDGGFNAWQAAQLPVSPRSIDDQLLRYERQVKLPGFGQQAQQRLQESHVLVVGAGGLGSPALLYLAGCGVGQLSLVDDDQVALNNLHRQILYTENDIGTAKAVAAEKQLNQLNSGIKVHAHNDRLTAANAKELLSGVNLVLDGTDNIQTRYLIDDVTSKLQIPWVYAAVSGFEVQVGLFSGRPDQPSYRSLFPDLQSAAIANCAEEGILGPIPGLAAMIQVTEAIKYLTEMGQCLTGKMLTYDLLNHQFKVLKYPAIKHEDCQD